MRVSEILGFLEFLGFWRQDLVEFIEVLQLFPILFTLLKVFKVCLRIYRVSE